MRKQARNVVAIVLVGVFCAAGAVAQEGGGQSGADFVINPPAARSDAMGGVVDGQGDPLEGMLYNPSTLMLDPNIQLNVGITPLPNGVTNTALTFGMPIGPGMLGVGAQLLSLGEFTYINAAGQPQGSVTLFDAAGTAGYSMYVWDHLSVGASAKVVYRTLGDSTGFGVGTDIGATWWFETPHVGQRPKPPTMEQLQAQLDRELKSIESEKEKRTREAAGDVADLRDDVAKLEGNLAKVEEDIAAAEADGKDTADLQAKKSEIETNLRSTRAALEDAEEAAADDLAAVEAWYEQAVAAARAAHSARVADLREIEAERARLFEVVDDPEAMLTADVIDENIDSAIARTREFLADRRQALRTANTTFRDSRSARLQEVQAQIASYQSQIDEIVGPEGTRLRREIAALEQRIEDLEAERAAAEEAAAAAEEAGEEPPPVPDVRDQVRAIRDELSTRQKELDDLQSDPWVRRLQRRIDDKEKLAADIEAAVAKFDADTQAAIDDLVEQTNRDVEQFNSLRETLKRDLRRAQLRRELDLIDAGRDRAIERALAKYEAEEQDIYQRLLSAMYENEEKIFDARRGLAQQDSADRTFEFEAELTNQRETAEDDFAFQERLYERQIADLQREEPVNESELASVQENLAQLREDYDAKIAELNEQEKSFQADEDARLKAELDAIKEERRKIRLIYLQTDDPYRNTSVTLAIRNLGTNVTFVNEGYPMPRAAALGVSYAVVNTDLHTVRLSAEAEMPLYGSPQLADLQVGVGLEYGFADLVEVRAGYGFGSPERSFSVGFGVDFALGFTKYAVDYVFRPLPDYGYQHSFGVGIGF